MIDYQTYQYSKEEFIKTLLLSLLLTSSISYLFYQSILVVILTSPAAILCMRYRKRQFIEERFQLLSLEFKETILSISNALNAGYSIENSLTEAEKDLELLYEGNSYMIKELAYMRYQLSLNHTIEMVFQEFAQRVPIEDVTNFVDVFVTAKRTGGDIIKIIHTTSKNMNDKIEIQREVQTLITAKKYEANLMSVVPLGIICYMWLSSPGYLDPLYHNLLGVVVMTVLLGLYVMAYLMIQKIVNIRV